MYCLNVDICLQETRCMLDHTVLSELTISPSLRNMINRRTVLGMIWLIYCKSNCIIAGAEACRWLGQVACDRVCGQWGSWFEKGPNLGFHIVNGVRGPEYEWCICRHRRLLWTAIRTSLIFFLVKAISFAKSKRYVLSEKVVVVVGELSALFEGYQRRRCGCEYIQRSGSGDGQEWNIHEIEDLAAAATNTRKISVTCFTEFAILSGHVNRMTLL